MKPIPKVVPHEVKCAVLLPDCIAEQVYIPEKDLAVFAVHARGEKIGFKSEIALPSGAMVKPIHDEFVRRGVVKFAQSAQWDGDVAGLESAVRAHISAFVWLSDDALAAAVAFVLCSWQANRFDTAPYLHLMGAPGSAKSRLLQVLADICYRGTRLGASSSRSSLFRVADIYRGTLALDESDLAPIIRES